MGKYLPEGMLGLAVTGLLAAFMAGVAANVTSFNTVFTYDLWQSYVRKDRDEGLLPARRAVRDGRWPAHLRGHGVHRQGLRQTS